MTLKGSCRCGAVRFTVESHTPVPYQRCYCSICRKQDGGGGYAINLGADMRTMRIEDPQQTIRVFRAEIADEEGHCEVSTGERNFCSACATALWLFSPEWPDLVHPFASAIDSELPVPLSRVHLMLKFKPSWVEVNNGPHDTTFDLYPHQSIEDWHKQRHLWVD
jgi:hypothetical protein